jgi:hypothetical protein
MICPSNLLCMMRVKNEAQWLWRSVERTLEVCDRIVIFDDGSTDSSLQEIKSRAIGTQNGDTSTFLFPGGKEIHWLSSPFLNSPEYCTDEVRDKNYLWSYVVRSIPFDWVLALDGDEMLSRSLLRYLRSSPGIPPGVYCIPFIYLWDSETTQRVDALYGDAPDGIKKLRFPRLLGLEGVSTSEKNSLQFLPTGRGGNFHCGSLPRKAGLPVAGPTLPFPIVHFGYLNRIQREDKLKFYQGKDPNNAAEGEYWHIVGKPNHLAPTEPVLAPWEDD